MTIGTVLRQALCSSSIQVAVGDEGAVKGNADLPAMRVPRNDQIVAVGSHCVEHPQVRRVRDTDRHIDLVAVDPPSDIGVTILVNVSVVGASETDPYTFDLKRRPGVGQVDPTRLLEPPPEILPRQRTFWQTIAPGLPTLQSLIFKTFEKGYVPVFRKYPFSQAKVIQTLKGRAAPVGPIVRARGTTTSSRARASASSASASRPRRATSFAPSRSRSSSGS